MWVGGLLFVGLIIFPLHPHTRPTTQINTPDPTHPDTLTEGELQAASHICAPSIIIPGAFKSATSSLFAAVVKHPQVLRVRFQLGLVGRLVGLLVVVRWLLEYAIHPSN